MAAMIALAQALEAVDRRHAAAPATRDAGVGDLLLSQQDRVRRLVHRLLGWSGRGTEIDDLVQDVLLAAWQHRGTFRGDASLATWVTAIAVRKVQNHARWARLRRRWRSLFDAAPDPGDVHARPATCPVESGDEIAALQRAMLALRHQDREVLVLHYLEDRAVGDVALLLGCSKNALEQRLTRARARLRVLLGERAERR